MWKYIISSLQLDGSPYDAVVVYCCVEITTLDCWTCVAIRHLTNTCVAIRHLRWLYAVNGLIYIANQGHIEVDNNDTHRL